MGFVLITYLKKVRLEHIREVETAVQAKWDADKTFESIPAYNADGTPKPKFMVTFPYPYMNGRLHLGHAFSLTKVRAFNLPPPLHLSYGLCTELNFSCLFFFPQ
jgi:hypothetical protein